MEWKTGDDKVLLADRFSVYGRELNVVNVTKDDTGRYVCVAKNIMGKISHSSNLNVIGEFSISLALKLSALKYIVHRSMFVLSVVDGPLLPFTQTLMCSVSYKYHLILLMYSQIYRKPAHVCIMV